MNTHSASPKATATTILALLTALTMGQSASTLQDLCTADHVSSSLPPIDGITYAANPTASITNNYNVVSQENFPASNGHNFCTVNLQYSHTGRGDTVNLRYQLPDPTEFKNRFLATGGRGTRLNFIGGKALDAGLVYGAVAGTTDGGVGGFDMGVDRKGAIVNQDGTVNDFILQAFSHVAIHEMTEIGQGFTKNFYGGNSTLRSYFQGCSEGGREGWAAAQNYPDDYDGLVIGAPAMSQAYVSPTHIGNQLYEHQTGYTPTLCELQRINQAVTDACDPLDGLTDGVVGRSDLCARSYNVTSAIGLTYNCPANNAPPPVWAFGSSNSLRATPQETGTVTAQGVQLFQYMLDGNRDSQNNLLYYGYLLGANSKYAGGGSYVNGNLQNIAQGVGAEWVTLYLDGQNAGNVDLSTTTLDSMRTWIGQGLSKFQALQNDNPDLSAIQSGNKKIIHFHGEADSSVPTRTSLAYQDSVRKQMFGSLSYRDGNEALNAFYRFFLVPGAQHCVPWATNCVYPDLALSQLIDWVENNEAPEALNGHTFTGNDVAQDGSFHATSTAGSICLWPTRPEWNGNTMSCVYPDQDAINYFLPTLSAVSPQ